MYFILGALYCISPKVGVSSSVVDFYGFLLGYFVPLFRWLFPYGLNIRSNLFLDALYCTVMYSFLSHDSSFIGIAFRPKFTFFGGGRFAMVFVSHSLSSLLF